MPVFGIRKIWESSAPLRLFLSVIGLGVLFALYAFRVSENPPGFYVDESAIAYNAYLVSQTGAGESGTKLPLFFPVYTGVFTQYANPTQIYLLAVVFKTFGPGILAARLTASACVFVACLLLGLLARRMSKSNLIGLIVFGLALTTPWLFEIGRIVLETFFYPAALVILLWSVHRVSGKQSWSYIDAGAAAVSLALVTYSYTIGRALGPMLAVGLIVFATSKVRLLSVVKVWTIYLLTLIPLIVYLNSNPGLSLRFRTLTYLRPDKPIMGLAGEFLYRFAEDINPLTMLFAGDINPRHHMPGTGGSFYLGTFILAVVGIGVVVARHRRNSWWLYVLFGLAASLVPGALTVDSFHTLRMIAYPVFLLVLTVPALDWLVGEGIGDAADRPASPLISPTVRLSAATAILGLTAAQAAFFFFQYHRFTADRAEYLDAAYKPLYDEAVAMRARPIYLVDGYWGPAYIHAFWYATVENRGLTEFVHLPYGEHAPPGSLVLSSEYDCSDCDVIHSEGGFILYVQNGQPVQGTDGEAVTR